MKVNSHSYTNMIKRSMTALKNTISGIG